MRNTITKKIDFDLQETAEGLWVLTLDGRVEVFESVEGLVRYLLER